MQPLFIPEAFTILECNQITKAARQADSADAKLVRGDYAHDIRRADLVWTDDLPGMDWVMDRLIDLLREANRSFGFTLDAMRESPQVARYGAERQGHFDWHSDIGKGELAARRKLTLVVQLSEPDSHAGGALELRPSTARLTAPRDQGHAVVFPSFMLHRVTPVTAGERHSLAIWAHGPAFR